MLRTRVTSKGQITVPKEVRDSLGLEPGDELEFVEEEGRFYITPHHQHSPFDAYVGYLKHLRKKAPMP